MGEKRNEQQIIREYGIRRTGYCICFNWNYGFPPDSSYYCDDNKFLKITVEKNKNDIRKLYKKLESAFQKFGLVKYDAFRQMGGQLSFSLALLDENNNGFLINSVHSTEGCYSYTKEIKQGECSISLSEEEVKALELAMGE